MHSSICTNDQRSYLQMVSIANLGFCSAPCWKHLREVDNEHCYFNYMKHFCFYYSNKWFFQFKLLYVIKFQPYSGKAKSSPTSPWGFIFYLGLKKNLWAASQPEITWNSVPRMYLAVFFFLWQTRTDGRQRKHLTARQRLLFQRCSYHKCGNQKRAHNKAK